METLQKNILSGVRRAGTVIFTAAILVVIMVACAVPRAPTGGEPERIPPIVRSVDPEAGTVNYEGRSVEIVFENYVDRASVEQSISVTPPFEQRPEVRVRGRRVVVTFPEALHENTTYILTMDTDLRTARNVQLEEPIVVAFSTGPTIDRGHLAGQVLDAHRNEVAEGYDVYAYAAPDSVPPETLPDRPVYRTRTDSDGRFSFHYLHEQPYYVIALEDRNRSRRPDPGEPFAVPPRPVLFAHPQEETLDEPLDDPLAAREDTLPVTAGLSSLPDTTEVEIDEDLGPWIVARLDTIPPEIQRARARSQHHVQVRFSEPVHLTERAPEDWSIVRNDSDQPVEVRDVFMHRDSDREVHVLTETLGNGAFRIRPAHVEDFHGNLFSGEPAEFENVDDAEPLALQFEGFLPKEEDADTTLVLPDERPGVVFNQPLSDSQFRDIVTVQDTTGASRTFSMQTRDGTTYYLDLDPSFEYGETVDIVVDERSFADADTLTAHRFQRIRDAELGSLSGVAASEDTTASIVVELFHEGQNVEGGPYRSVTADPDGSFMFDDLPEGVYRLRLFVDLNENGRWDGGTIIPYEPPEPIRWVDGSEDVRARWESVIEDTIYVPVLR